MCDFHAYIKCPLDYLEEGFNISEICEKMDISKKKLLSKYKEDFIVFIKKLVAEGRTYNNIAKLTGISRTTVGLLHKEDQNLYKLTDEKINQIVEFSKSRMTPSEVSKKLGITIYHVHGGLKKEIISSYLKLKSISNLKSEFRIRGPTIAKLIHDQGVEFHKGNSVFGHYGEGKYPFFKPVSSYLNDIIVGELLGDAHIREIKSDSGKYSKDTPGAGINEYKNALNTLKKLNESENIKNIEEAIQKFNASVKVIQNTKVTSFALGLKLESSNWVRFVGDKFKEENYGISYYIDKRDENSKYNKQDMLRINTQSSIHLQKFREEWYVITENGKNLKILPEGLGLNENRVLHWYVGDGSYSGGYVGFSTEGFLEEDTRKLSELLNEEIRINSYVNKSKINAEGEDNWRIRFGSKESVDKFFEYLEGAEKKDLELAKKVFPHKFPS